MTRELTYMMAKVATTLAERLRNKLYWRTIERQGALYDLQRPDLMAARYQRQGLGECDHCGRLARASGCLDRHCPNHDGTFATISWTWGVPEERQGSDENTL